MKRTALLVIVAILIGLLAGLLITRTGQNPGKGIDNQALNSQIENFIMDNPKVIMNSVQQFQREQRRAQQQQQNQKAEKLAEQREDDYIRGNKDARISLIEYSDFECSYCQKFHPTAQKLVDQSDGEINWIYRHLPLPMHDGAEPKAVAAECAAAQKGNDMFWTFADAFLEDKLAMDSLDDFAGEQGLDVDKFKTCREDDKYKDRVQKQKQEAQSVGITGTPGIVLVNKESGEHRVISGAVPLSQLKQAVSELK